MLRQRIRSRGSALGAFGALPLLLVALALTWYGLMCALLAAQVSPATVNAISGYRTVFDALAAAGPLVSGTARAIAAGAGLLACLVFGSLAVKRLPRPYLARGDLQLEPVAVGRTAVAARAVERLAEIAATEPAVITNATARFGTDDLQVTVDARDASDLPRTLTGVRERVHAALAEHDLPDVPVNVTLGGFDRPHARTLR